MTLLLLSVVPIFVCCLVHVKAQQSQFVACYDTKCAEVSGNVARYKDCEPSLSRVVFCNDKQYCVHNSMTGKGICLMIPTEPPPTTVLDTPLLTAQQKLALSVSLPLLLLLLIVVCAIIFWCYKKRKACFKIKKPKKVRTHLPSFIELHSVVKSVSQKSAQPLWLQNYANFYELDEGDTNDKHVIANTYELDKENDYKTYD